MTPSDVPQPADDSSRWSADDALTQLYAVHWRPLVRLSYLLVRDQQLAEEVVQDAFVAVHARWRRLGDHEHALSYLRVAVVNGSRTALRWRGVW
jgi:DNA-directed RNA polymerase specialized sigma24 family protein